MFEEAGELSFLIGVAVYLFILLILQLWQKGYIIFAWPWKVKYARIEADAPPVPLPPGVPGAQSQHKKERLTLD